MKGSVSSRRLSVFPLASALSLAGVACSILAMDAFPWMGPGWVAAALSAALWSELRSSPARSVAQVLQGIDAEPLAAVAAQSRVPRRRGHGCTRPG